MGWAQLAQHKWIQSQSCGIEFNTMTILLGRIPRGSVSHSFKYQRGSRRKGSMVGALCELHSWKRPVSRCARLSLMTCLALFESMVLSPVVSTWATSHTLILLIRDAQILLDPFDEFFITPLVVTPMCVLVAIS